MNNRFDALTRSMGQPAHRRRALQGLGALALGAVGVVGLDQAARAERCQNRCKDHCKNRHQARNSNHQCRRVCQQRCDRS